MPLGGKKQTGLVPLGEGLVRHGPNICAGSRWSHSYESQPQLLDPERQLRDVKLHVSIRSCKGSFENFAPLYQRLCLCVSSMFFLFFCWIVNVPCLVFLLSVLEFLFHCCHCTLIKTTYHRKINAGKYLRIQPFFIKPDIKQIFFIMQSSATLLKKIFCFGKLSYFS